MQPLDLLETADLLLGAGNGQPTQASIRRAYSSIYYAVFHVICQDCADSLIGCTEPCRAQRAWNQVYRALDHTPAKSRCKELEQENHKLNFPDAIKELALLLVELQTKRHEADYDIRATFSATDAMTQLGRVREAAARYGRVSRKHRKAFAAYLLINRRTKNPN